MLERQSLSKDLELKIYTIGHSTRTLEEFEELIKIYNISLLIDVRTVPYSRHNPQFNKETLPLKLKPTRYIHLPEIGGLRHPKPNSINLALKNSGFRGYADYMQTKEFTESILKLIALAKENTVTLMCAEALPWGCHRTLISDALVARQIKVLHILGKESVIIHQLNESAHVEGHTVTYPLFSQQTPQRKLGDF